MGFSSVDAYWTVALNNPASSLTFTHHHSYWPAASFEEKMLGHS